MLLNRYEKILVCPLLSGMRFEFKVKGEVIYNPCIGEDCMLWVDSKIVDNVVIHRAGCGLIIKREEERLP